jgi:cytochrome P450/ferredoxin-NADP reductase
MRDFQIDGEGKCPFLANGMTAESDEVIRGLAESFDPFSPEYMANPPGYLQWSRERLPVFYNAEIGYWVVSCYDDVKAVFRDNVTFSPSIALEKMTPSSDEAMAVLDGYGYGMGRTLVNEDEPAHMPRRRALAHSFTPSELAHHEEDVRRITREYVDRIVDDGHADLVAAMLWELPLTVALHFLGVPEEDMATIRRYSVAHIVNTWGRPAPEQQLAVAESVGKFWQLSGEILEKIRANPSGPGWMPYAVRQNKLLPDIVTDSYLHSIMLAGIVAAHETTANASANAIKLLLENKSSWLQICADPTLIPNAVEECLRHSGSVIAWRRIATRDTVVGGVEIPEGAKLLIMSSSANHDEREFERPDDLDIRRANAGEHLTFGFGSHQCLGKNLARMELQIILEELTSRLPHLELDTDQSFTYLANTSFRGPEHLWVSWDPAKNPERSNPRVLEQRLPVRIGEPSSKLISYRLVVSEREQVAESVVRLRFESPVGEPLPHWAPGSHIDLECGDVSRQYSLCGDPDDRRGWDIAVRREEQSRGGSLFVHQELSVGDEVHIRGPRNHFRLEAHASHHIFIAGGIGITPIITMAHHARLANQSYEVHYAGKSRNSMAFIDSLIKEHGDALHVYPSDEQIRLDIPRLLRQVREDVRVYVCGPPRLLDGVKEVMHAWPEESLRTEHFSATIGVLDPDKEHGFDVVLRDSGVTLSVPPNRTLLDVLREANIDVQSDCEEGLCGSCEVVVLAGEIDHRDVVLSAKERSENRSMMTCCSRARGEFIEVAL